MDFLNMSTILTDEHLTTAAVSSTTPAPDDTDDVIQLIWIIPSVLGVVAVIVLFALGLFYCIRGLELAFIRHCSSCCTCCPCCCEDATKRDEYIHLNETFDIYNESYTINGRWCTNAWVAYLTNRVVICLKMCSPSSLTIWPSIK